MLSDQNLKMIMPKTHQYSKPFFLYLVLTWLFIFNSYTQNFVNGDFESGYGVGFIVNGNGYNQINPPFSGTTNAGDFSVTTNPQLMNTSYFISGGDHTTGFGNMLVIDGNNQGGQPRFYKAGNSGSGVTGLIVGASYTFSYWIKSVATSVVDDATKADIGIQFNNAINVLLVSGSKLAPLPVQKWKQVVYTFVPTNSTINIELWNNNTNFEGNDFAIDDLSLLLTPVPLSLTYSSNNPTCVNTTDGSIIAYGIGGQSPYINYSLTGTSTDTNSTGIFTNLKSGTYSILITDSNNDVFTLDNIVLAEPNDLTVSPDTSICLGSSTTLTVSGSSSGYTWTSSPNDPTLTTPNSASPTVTPLQTTKYTVTSTVTTATKNLLYNGDFALGNVGFYSDYDFLSFSDPVLGEPKSYGITKNAKFWNNGFSACTDYSTTGNMMVVDGSIYNSGNDKVWCQTIVVNPNVDYKFSYWFQSLSLTNQANLDVTINGISIGIATAPNTTCDWVNKIYNWNSGTNTLAQICIYDRNISAGGNDFAIDNMEFIGSPIVCNLSKTLTITVSSLNLVIINPAVSCLPTVDITDPSITTGTTSGTTFTYWEDSLATIPLSNPNAISVSGTYYIKGTFATCSDIKPVVVAINPGVTPPKPVVTTPIEYCLNSPALPLKAVALPGLTLNWYGTDATGGTASSIPTIPTTDAVGTKTYYVSQSSGSCESPRAAIVVNVVADTGGVLKLFCDSANTTPTSLAIDWNNVIGYQGYYWSYSIAGGPIVNGFQVSPSHIDIPVPGPGTSVTFTINSVKGLPCVASATVTCNSTCTTNTTPDFPVFSPICFGTTAPILPSASPNGISGTWLPATVSNTTSGSYVFTPNPILFPCALSVTRGVTVTPTPTAGTLSGNQNVCEGLTTTFSSTKTGGKWSSSDNNIATVIPNSGVITGVAEGTAVLTYTVLGTGGCSDISDTRNVIVTKPPNPGNLSGIQNVCEGSPTVFTSTVAGGIWSSSDDTIATINANSGDITTLKSGIVTMTYTVKGTGGCKDVGVTRILTVIQKTIPTFDTFAPICNGSVLSPLPTISNNGVTGTWSPALDNTKTTTYTFTPTLGLCATTTTLTITVNPNVIPMFAAFAPVCENSTPPVLPTSSGNIPPITGTWSPKVTTAVLGTTTYTFTPDPGQCVDTTTPATIEIYVVAITTPNFAQIAPICYGKTAPTLSNTSPNGVDGTWSPSVISNVQNGTYLFTPKPDQCAATQTLNVKITPRTIPNFVITPFCVGFTAPILPATSPNGVTGTWQPATIDNTTNGTYIFTPNTNECATIQTINLNLIPRTQPNFKDIAICYGSTAPVLNTTSPNGIKGTWSPSVIDNLVDGIYVFTPNANECATLQSINVTINQPTLKSVKYTVTNPFSENQIITVTASDAGNYMYQLDFGPLQTSNIFENVTSGIHAIKVIDVNGCSNPIITNNVLVIGYPKFFTPNGDGYNDTWNIFSLSEQSNSKIFIFDKYGKLLKQIDPRGKGWDGTYNGKNLPSTDYWFTVEYTQDNVIKVFRSHFTLKR